MRKTLALITAALSILVLFAAVQGPALAATTPKFLKLPFDDPKRIAIQRAWITRGKTGAFDLVHHAIDYVNGKRDGISGWQPFDVMAAAEGEACGAMTNQGGCFDSGEIMGNRVLIKHKVDGETYYTFYNHLDTIADKIPLNNAKDTVHVDAGEVIGVAGASNSQGLLHLHWELLDKNFKPIDPYGIYGITDQYPDPRGKNGKLAKKKSYFIDNPPLAFGVVPKPTPGPTDDPLPSGAGESPAVSDPPESLDPGATPVPVPTGSGASPGATQVAIVGTPQPGATGSPTAPASGGGGLGILPIAIGIGAVVAAALLLGLTLMSRRRRDRTLPRDTNWRP